MATSWFSLLLLCKLVGRFDFCFGVMQLGLGIGAERGWCVIVFRLSDGRNDAVFLLIYKWRDSSPRAGDKCQRRNKLNQSGLESGLCRCCGCEGTEGGGRRGEVSASGAALLGRNSWRKNKDQIVSIKIPTKIKLYKITMFCVSTIN